MSPELRFLEDRPAVPCDLEASAAGGLERDVRRREFLFQLGRQTDGPWLVASKGAVLDFQVHHLLPVPSAALPGIPARFASFWMTESCFAVTALSESICSCSVAMSCRCA